MSADFDLSGYTLFERQSKFYNAHICAYCLKETELIDSIKVYRESYGLIFYCGDCQAWCGVHHGSSDQSLGVPAKKELRDLRHEAHKWYEPLIAAKVNQLGVSKRKAKAAGYAWIAKLLNIDTTESHIGYFNIKQCEIVIKACKAIYPSPEVIAERATKISNRIELIELLAGVYVFDVKRFEMNGFLQLELKHPDTGEVYKFKPKDQEFILPPKGKRKPQTIKVPDLEIEAFIEAKFGNLKSE